MGLEGDDRPRMAFGSGRFNLCDRLVLRRKFLISPDRQRPNRVGRKRRAVILSAAACQRRG